MYIQPICVLLAVCALWLSVVILLYLSVDQKNFPMSEGTIDNSMKVQIRPRMLHILKKSPLETFGINLKLQPSGLYAGDVEPASLAGATGLKSGDRIIEINGQRISSLFLDDNAVVQLISNNSMQLMLLVIDPEALKYATEENIIIHSEMSGIEAIKTPHMEKILSYPNADVNPPRLLHIVSNTGSKKFGFQNSFDANMGHHISCVYPNTPAAAIGLKAWDRIVEVNGINIQQFQTPSVVEAIRSQHPTEIKILVVDTEALRYYNENGIIIHSEMPGIMYMKTPEVLQQARDTTSIENISEETVNRLQEFSVTISDINLKIKAIEETTTNRATEIQEEVVRLVDKIEEATENRVTEIQEEVVRLVNKIEEATENRVKEIREELVRRVEKIEEAWEPVKERALRNRNKQFEEQVAQAFSNLKESAKNLYAELKDTLKF